MTLGTLFIVIINLKCSNEELKMCAMRAIALKENITAFQMKHIQVFRHLLRFHKVFLIYDETSL